MIVSKHASFVLLIGLVSVSALADEPDATLATDVTAMFNGKDLTGWEGREGLWSVEDGAIVGRTTEANKLKANTFLVWKGGQPENFELTLFFKIEAGNSGVQYRSTVKDANTFVVGGYQADIDFANRYAGILYEEKGRGILAQRGEKVSVMPDGKKDKKTFGDSKKIGMGIHQGKWNEFRVVANGSHLQHFINGAMTAEVIDEQAEKAAKKGVIALQLHVGPPMVVRFKNMTLRTLK